MRTRLWRKPLSRELAHAGVHQREAGPPLGPGREQIVVVLPLDRLVLRPEGVAEDPGLEPGELGEEVAPVELADQLVVLAQGTGDGVEGLPDRHRPQLVVQGEAGGAALVGGLVPGAFVLLVPIEPPEDGEGRLPSSRRRQLPALRQQLVVDRLGERGVDAGPGPRRPGGAGGLRHLLPARRPGERRVHLVGRAAAGEHLAGVGESQVVAPVERHLAGGAHRLDATVPFSGKRRVVAVDEHRLDAVLVDQPAQHLLGLPPEAVEPPAGLGELPVQVLQRLEQHLEGRAAEVLVLPGSHCAGSKTKHGSTSSDISAAWARPVLSGRRRSRRKTKAERR